MYKLVAQEWPRWIPLRPAAGDEPEVSGQFKRITRAMKRRAQREAATSLGEMAEGAERDVLDIADAGDVYTRSIIAQGLIDWKGIGDADGKVLAFAPDLVELFLDNEDLFDAADEAYVTPEVRRDAEKNGLSASPNGTGVAATPASDTATSPASTAAASGATNAPTASMSSRRKRAKTSGN